MKVSTRGKGLMASAAEVEDGRLPDFVIAGAMKSGTTSLQNALSKHREVYVAPGEPHFFCEHTDKDIVWYRKQFRDAGTVRLVGEKCADYLCQARAVEGMGRLLPNARIIVMLRNPVDRAYSHYWHERRLNHEKLSFADAIKAEPDRRRSSGGMAFAYVEMGRYVAQLEHLASFFPKRLIHVILFEDFKADASLAFAEACRFLEIDDSPRPKALERRANPFRYERVPRLYEKLKRSGLYRRLSPVSRRRLEKALVRPRDYPPMDDTVRARLTEAFAPDNFALAQWLGRPLTAWGNGGASVR